MTGAGRRPRAARVAGPSSPCVQICALHPVWRLCVGCGRSGDEIAVWSRLDEAGRAAVMAALPERMAAMAASAGASSQAPNLKR